MNFKELLEKYGVEVKDELVKELETAYNKKDDNAIPYDRFKTVNSQKNELLEKVADLEAKLENFEKLDIKGLDSKLKTYEEKLNNYQKKELEERKSKFKDIYDFLNVPQDHKDYEKAQKIRNSFKDLPESFEEITDEQLNSYEPIADVLKSTGIFEQKKIADIPKSRQSNENFTSLDPQKQWLELMKN
jgi:cysteinyl-tRNA synthetase